MRLLKEYFLPDDELIETKIDDKDKNVYLRGVFTESNSLNRNNRIYPDEYVQREVAKLNKKINSPTKLLAELDHPEVSEYKLSNAAAIITKLGRHISEPNIYVGEARVLKDTSKGKTLYALCKEGVKLGISSRSLGSLKEDSNGHQIVQEDLNMITWDLCSDPSSQKAFLESIFESKEWIVGENGVLTEDVAKTFKNSIDKIYSNPKNKQLVEEKISDLFQNFLNTI